MRKHEIPYPENVPDLFEAISDLPWAVFLDSAGLGRYDILAAAPFVTLVTRNGTTEIAGANGVTLSEEDPFDLVRRRLLPYSNQEACPFTGGAIGYFGYDLGLELNRITPLDKDASPLPDLAVGIYDWAVVVDHEQKRAHLASSCRDPHTEDLWDALLTRLSGSQAGTSHEAFRLTGAIEVTPQYPEYALAFEKIRAYIHSGDCYQVNFAQRFEAPFSGDPWTLYRASRTSNPAPFSAFLSNPYCTILSASPERFLKVEANQVETKPIKGTRPRSENPETDACLARSLAESEKDRAENLMIVDLLRNDLGRICETGSVRVERLFEIESFATVHHMVSTISGRITQPNDAFSLLRASFPGGSITGAPKIRAMQIIEEIEPFRRGLYCGSIAHIGFDGNMDSSIAIRTMVAAHGSIRLWAGGGIVADSGLDAEYQEIRHKAQAMLRLLESPHPSC